MLRPLVIRILSGLCVMIDANDQYDFAPMSCLSTSNLIQSLGMCKSHGVQISCESNQYSN